MTDKPAKWKSSPRIYPKDATEKQKREIDNLSDLSAYAYGFSNQRPRATYWIIQAGMVLFCLASCVHVVHPHA